MREERDKEVGDTGPARRESAGSLKRLPQRTTATTKQAHQRLLRALGDRRIKRVLG